MRMDGEGMSRKNRLELIRQRHQALILKPREAIAEECEGEFDDPFDDFDEAEHLELVEAASGSET